MEVMKPVQRKAVGFLWNCQLSWCLHPDVPRTLGFACLKQWANPAGCEFLCEKSGITDRTLPGSYAADSQCLFWRRQRLKNIRMCKGAGTTNIRRGCEKPSEREFTPSVGRTELVWKAIPRAILIHLWGVKSSQQEAKTALDLGSR